MYAVVHKVNWKTGGLQPPYENVDGSGQGSDSRVAPYTSVTLIDNDIYGQEVETD